MARKKSPRDDGKQQSSLDAFAAIRNAVSKASGIGRSSKLDEAPEQQPVDEEIDGVELSPTPTEESSLTPDILQDSIPPNSVEKELSLAGEVVSSSSVQLSDNVRGPSPLRTFDMPSAGVTVNRPPATDVNYHDLAELFSEPPISEEMGKMMFHRCILHEIAGVSQLLDWVSDGDAVIVELTKIISRETEFSLAIDKLSTFIEGDIGGQIIQLTDSRLLLLPPGCRGISGVETESFVVEA